MAVAEEAGVRMQRRRLKRWLTRAQATSDQARITAEVAQAAAEAALMAAEEVARRGEDRPSITVIGGDSGTASVSGTGNGNWFGIRSWDGHRYGNGHRHRHRNDGRYIRREGLEYPYRSKRVFPKPNRSS